MQTPRIGNHKETLGLRVRMFAKVSSFVIVVVDERPLARFV
jgi:hypothetical protein